MRLVFSLSLSLFFSSLALADDSQIKALLEAQGQVDHMEVQIKAGIIHRCKQTGRTHNQCVSEVSARRIKNIDVVLLNSYRDTYSDSEITDMLNYYESEGGKKRAHNDLLYFKKQYGMDDGEEYIQLTKEEEDEFKKFKFTPGGKKITEHSTELKINVKKYLHLLEQEAG